MAALLVGVILLLYRASWEWWYRKHQDGRASTSRWANHAVIGLIALALIFSGLGLDLVAGLLAIAVGVLGVALIALAIQARRPSV